MPSFRLAIVVTHVIQYYAPWFRYLATLPNIELRVFYLSDHGLNKKKDAQFGTSFAWDIDLLSGYQHEFIPNRAKHPDVSRFFGLYNPDLRRSIKSFSPSAILIFGYAYRPHLGLVLDPPAPLIFRGDSHLLGAPAPSRLKTMVLGFIYSRCAAFLPVGKANIDYFQYFGVTDQKLFIAPHCVDESHFQATRERLAEASELRSQMGIPEEAPVVLFSGKFIAKKRPDLLLAAFLRADIPGSHLVLAGDGELLPSLRAAATGKPRVHFLPFANQSAMPARYLLGDLLVLPSQGRQETWGLAVNECMHLGRPALVSDHVGCHPDLVIPGQTGWVFGAGNEMGLANSLSDALSLGRNGLARIGENSKIHASAFSYKAAGEGLMRALCYVAVRP